MSSGPSRGAARIYESQWEVYDLPRPTPFGLELFAAFSRETLLAQDPDRALDELVAALYEQWNDSAPNAGQPFPRRLLQIQPGMFAHASGALWLD